MDWQSGKIKLYTEAGLALLLVLTLAVAGATGVLSPREEKETVSVSEAEFQSEGNEATEKDPKQISQEAEETIADGQYPIMGESAVTVRRWWIILILRGNCIPLRNFRRAARTRSKPFARCIMKKRRQRVYALRWRSHRR